MKLSFLSKGLFIRKTMLGGFAFLLYFLALAYSTQETWNLSVLTPDRLSFLSRTEPHRDYDDHSDVMLPVFFLALATIFSSYCLARSIRYFLPKISSLTTTAVLLFLAALFYPFGSYYPIFINGFVYLFLSFAALYYGWNGLSLFIGLSFFLFLFLARKTLFQGVFPWWLKASAFVILIPAFLLQNFCRISDTPFFPGYYLWLLAYALIAWRTFNGTSKNHREVTGFRGIKTFFAERQISFLSWCFWSLSLILYFFVILYVWRGVSPLAFAPALSYNNSDLETPRRIAFTFAPYTIGLSFLLAWGTKKILPHLGFFAASAFYIFFSSLFYPFAGEDGPVLMGWSFGLFALAMYFSYSEPEGLLVFLSYLLFCALIWKMVRYPQSSLLMKIGGGLLIICDLFLLSYRGSPGPPMSGFHLWQLSYLLIAVGVVFRKTRASA